MTEDNNEKDERRENNVSSFADGTNQEQNQNLTPRQERNLNRKQFNQNLDNMGAGILEKTGVPKPIAQAAVKTKGGPLSPGNMPAARMMSSKVRNKVADAKSKFAKPNSNGADRTLLAKHQAMEKTVNKESDSSIPSSSSLPNKNEEIEKKDDNNNNVKNNKNQLPGKLGKLAALKDGFSNFLSNGKELAKSGLKKLFISGLPLTIIIPFSLIMVLFLIILIAAVSSDNESSATDATYTNKLYKNTKCDKITLDGKEMNFEDYIAGVVSIENGRADLEARKAQAVAARTYALRYTDDCKKPITNSQSAQTYTTPSEAGIEAANATSGEIMLDENGKYHPANYSSYPSSSPTKWYSYPACTAPQCNGSSCTVKMYRIKDSSNVTGFDFTMPAKNNIYTMVNGDQIDLTAQSGFCYGMSQYGADYLSGQGKDYIEILSTFYDFAIQETSEQVASDSNTNASYWKQTDPKWANDTTLGGQTIGAYGCLATSITIQIAKSNAPLSSEFTKKYKELNPGTAIAFMNSKGAFGSGGLMNNTNAGSFIAPKFQLDKSAETTMTTNDAIKLIDEGCYLVASVTGNYVRSTHWVAIDSVKTKNKNDLYMFDPGSDETKLYNRYNSVNAYKCYKVK